MKTLTKAFFILLVMFCFSCSETEDNLNRGQWMLQYSNDNNWSVQTIMCDSLQMVNKNEVYVYVKGVKTHIFADKLYPMFNK